VLLFAGQEFEELLDRLQQYRRISVLEVGSCQKIGANHLGRVLFWMCPLSVKKVRTEHGITLRFQVSWPERQHSVQS
jgi:hypothetical protein